MERSTMFNGKIHYFYDHFTIFNSKLQNYQMVAYSTSKCSWRLIKHLAFADDLGMGCMAKKTYRKYV